MEHLVHLRVVLQEGGDDEGVAHVGAHPDSEGANTAQTEVAVERRRDCACSELNEGELLGHLLAQALARRQRTHNHV